MPRKLNSIGQSILEKWWWDIIPAWKIFVMTFCDPLGINISTPPDALHAILLGHGTHLLNAFARLEKEQKEKKRKDDREKVDEEDSEEEDEEKPSEKKKRKNFVFSGEFKKLVFTEILDVGFWLGKQSDPDKTRTHFCSGFLPKAGKGDDNTTEKNKLMR